MDRGEIIVIVDRFLSTLDKFNITSDDGGDINFVSTESLSDYWLNIWSRSR